MKAEKEAVDFINKNPKETQKMVIKSIKDSTKQEIDQAIVEEAMSHITFTSDVDENVLQKFGQSSYDLKFLKEKPDFTGLVETNL